MNSLRVHKVYAGLLVAVFLFQLVTLLRISWSIGMWIDELYTLNAISLPWSDMLLERCRRGHPPLYFICAKATWLLTKGTTLPPEFRLRLISLVSWVTAVGAFAFMARRFLSPGAALLATTILVCSNISLLQAGNGRMYALALLLAVVHVGVTYQLARTEKTSLKLGTLYLLSAVLGASVTPSFFLLQLGTAIGLTVASHDRSHRLGLGLATLLTAFLYYLPCVYFYLITPHQLGPVSKHVSRIAYAIPALLTGIGRGKLPEGEDKLQWIGFAISAVVTVLVVSTIVKNMKSSGPAVKALWITFLTPFVVLLGGAVLSLIPSLSFLRIGTDRYLAVFVPSGALLTGAAAEKFASRLLPYLIGIVLVMMKMVALPSANEAKEGRVFRQEVQSLCSQEQLLDVPLIACPPEIVPGIELYCPRLSPSTTFGINSLDMPSLEKCVENATSVGKLLVIYYRAHVPQVLAKCKDRFSTVTLLSKRVYGGSKDPIFAIFLFEDAVPANRR